MRGFFFNPSLEGGLELFELWVQASVFALVYLGSGSLLGACCELHAYRPGRNAQQAVVEVEELLFRGHPEVVDADL